MPLNKLLSKLFSNYSTPGSYTQLFRDPFFSYLLTKGDKKYLNPDYYPKDLSGVLPKTYFVFEPPIDLTETKGAFTIKADVPGFHKENIKVSFNEENGEISIVGNMNAQTAEQLKEEEQAFGEYVVRERTLIPDFDRRIHLPYDLVDWDNVKAVIKHGQLTVSVPKKVVDVKETTKPHKSIEVEEF
ncbi:hypothetical protein ABK040_003714 [Willaertia magna]